MSIVLQYFETASLSTNVFSINFHLSPMNVLMRLTGSLTACL